MSQNLISYNFVASEELKTGQALQFDAENTKTYQRSVKKASGIDGFIGVSLCDCQAGENVTVAAIVTGQMFGCAVGENVNRGDRLGLKSDSAGIFFKTGVTTCDLIALDNAAAGDRVDALCLASASYNGVADRAKGAETMIKGDGSPLSVGGYTKWTWFGVDGKPRLSPSTIGSESQGIYISNGEFKPCTGGGSAPEFFEVDITVPSSGSYAHDFGSGGHQIKLTFRTYTSGVEGLQLNYRLLDGSAPVIVNAVLTEPKAGDAQIPAVNIPILFKAETTSERTLYFPKPAYATSDAIVRKFKLMLTITPA